MWSTTQHIRKRRRWKPLLKYIILYENKRGRKPVKGLDNDRRGSPREHPQLPREALWVMTSLPVRRPHWGGYCATSGCACAHPVTPSGSRDLRSLPIAMVLVLPVVEQNVQVAHAHTIISGHFRSGPLLDILLAVYLLMTLRLAMQVKMKLK